MCIRDSSSSFTHRAVSSASCYWFSIPLSHCRTDARIRVQYLIVEPPARGGRWGLEQYRSAQRRRVAQGSTERRLEKRIVKNTSNNSNRHDYHQHLRQPEIPAMRYARHGMERSECPSSGTSARHSRQHSRQRSTSSPTYSNTSKATT